MPNRCIHVVSTYWKRHRAPKSACSRQRIRRLVTHCKRATSWPFFCPSGLSLKIQDLEHAMPPLDEKTLLSLGMLFLRGIVSITVDVIWHLLKWAGPTVSRISQAANWDVLSESTESIISFPASPSSLGLLAFHSHVESEIYPVRLSNGAVRTVVSAARGACNDAMTNWSLTFKLNASIILKQNAVFFRVAILGNVFKKYMLR